MTPQAIGFPESPAIKLSAEPPRPRLSSSAVITTALPITPLGPPLNDIIGST